MCFCRSFENITILRQNLELPFTQYVMIILKCNASTGRELANVGISVFLVIFRNASEELFDMWCATNIAIIYNISNRSLPVTVLFCVCVSVLPVNRCSFTDDNPSVPSFSSTSNNAPVNSSLPIQWNFSCSTWHSYLSLVLLSLDSVICTPLHPNKNNYSRSASAVSYLTSYSLERHANLDSL